MKIQRDVFEGVDEKGRPVFPGFISYVDNEKPILIHRYGRLDYSDAYDDFCDCFSHDNGKSWTQPQLRLKGYQFSGGTYIRYAENACLFDRTRNKLFTFASKRTYTGNKIDVDGPSWVVYDVFDWQEQKWKGEQEISLHIPGGVFISFCFPVALNKDILLIPAITRMIDKNRNIVHYKGCWAPANRSFLIKAKILTNCEIEFSTGQPAEIDLEMSSRGLGENTIAVLKSGTIAMVCRGDNSMFPERPGYKWVCFSSDQGENWSLPQPLICDDGTFFESGSNGSALFRAEKNGKLYWIGNLCITGEKAKGNWPRYPLVIAEINEEPFCIKKSTITVVDTRQNRETETVQLSNFRFYQDRENGDIVVFLTRFGENDTNWKGANYYRYRITL
ncbi:MAG TPA: sialidase family protein [bacterium]|nr:sialidase family protein [bacterium]